MKRVIGLCAIWFFALFAACSGLEGKVKWHDDYSQAVVVSRDQTKPMVLLFTGSDWCAWCIRLKEDILDTPEFAKEVGDEFVFVYVDFPSNSNLPEAIAKQNRELKERYKVGAFPTVLVVDSEGGKLGQANFTGVESVDQFANHLRSAAGARAAPAGAH